MLIFTHYLTLSLISFMPSATDNFILPVSMSACIVTDNLTNVLY